MLRILSAHPEEHEIAVSAVAVLAPDPRGLDQSQSTWTSFLKTHWDVLASVDFTTIEVWTKSGLVTCYLLFVMELATRRVHSGGLYRESRRILDVPGWEASERRRRRIPARQEVPAQETAKGPEPGNAALETDAGHRRTVSRIEDLQHRCDVAHHLPR